MTTLSASEKGEDLLVFLVQQFAQVESADSLQKIKTNAWNHFRTLGLPTRKFEAFCYLKLRNFFAQNYIQSQISAVSKDQLKPFILPTSKNSVFVFVNGSYQPALSDITGLPKNAVALPLNEAMRTYGTFITNQCAKSLKDETDPLAALNTALHKNGLFLYLPPKCIVEAPIQILQVIDSQDKAMLIMPRVHVFAGAQSEADLFTSYAVLSGTDYAINQYTDFAVEEAAQLRYNQLGYHSSPTIWHFDALRATLKRDSNLKTVHVTEGSATIRNDYRVIITGENAQASLNGIWMTGETREAHTHVVIDHQAPHCRSFQLFKGVLSDASKSSFEGKILVRQAAQKTDAFQLNNNLLLSDKAHADSKPNLEIFADDVKASHGATVGQLDNEQLFYMKTRGFSEAEAKNMLVYSFCQEVIDLVSIPSLKAQITARIKNQ